MEKLPATGRTRTCLSNQCALKNLALSEKKHREREREREIQSSFKRPINECEVGARE